MKIFGLPLKSNGFWLVVLQRFHKAAGRPTLILYTYLADLLLGHSSLSTSAQDSLYSGYWCKGRRSITTHLSPAKKKVFSISSIQRAPYACTGCKIRPFCRSTLPKWILTMQSGNTFENFIYYKICSFSKSLHNM